MRDTGFDVPPDKISRLAIVYEDAKPAAVAKSTNGNGDAIQLGRFVEADSYPEKGRGFAAGGSGMFSTIGDYARFAQMLLNGGELDGVRILGQKMVEPMTANHSTILRA